MGRLKTGRKRDCKNLYEEHKEMRDSCLETCRRPSFFPHENRKSSGPRLFTWNQRHPITAFSPFLQAERSQTNAEKRPDHTRALLHHHRTQHHPGHKRNPQTMHGQPQRQHPQHPSHTRRRLPDSPPRIPPGPPALPGHRLHRIPA